MAESIVSELVVKVIEYLGGLAIEKIAPYFGGSDKLNELKETMKMIQARLSDAAKRQEADHDGELIKAWLDSLRRVMYRIEDLVEEIPVAESDDEELQSTSSKLKDAVRFFPSIVRSLKLNKRLFLEAESIMKELDRVTSNMNRFHFNMHASSTDQERHASRMMNRREETHSFILDEEVIGRDEDKSVLLQMVLERDDDKNLSVIPIVGMGGLGKTTLAQFVYNDKQVQQCFELRYWVCISDQVLSFVELVKKVLQSIKGEKNQCESTVEQLQLELRQAVSGKKFLLILDDVWDESRERWLCLERLLRGGKLGSKILVTTRSMIVASNMGTTNPYLLATLPEEMSWALFKRMAFKHKEEEINPCIVSIGKEIVKKCGNVPLAIRTIGSLLYSRDTVEDWVHFRDREIGMIEQKENDIMPTLKISYNHLLPQQKLCFAYCALFPKDYEIDIKALIRLWMAQGFVKSLEDGHICYMELLRRCFLQNMNVVWLDMVWHRKDKCHMHDLMHDLAQIVGDECLVINGPRENVNSTIRHVNLVVKASQSRFEYPPWLLASSHTRSCLISQQAEDSYWISTHPVSEINDIVSSFRGLRVLHFGVNARYERIPDTIGKLKHLRYLRISGTRHQYLPSGITKLRYLQTLHLDRSRLKELPKSFYKLTGLEYLQITSEHMEPSHCLIDLPPRFGELTCLQSLDPFVVGENNGLDALCRMNLTGKLRISYKKHRPNAIGEAKMANLKAKKLTDLTLVFDTEVQVNEADELLECLQPPPTLKHLVVQRWNGARFPNWGRDKLPNLVSLELHKCRSCQHLPSFSGLSHIKSLVINECEELDLWDDVKLEDGDAHSSCCAWTCLKSLQSLQLQNMNLESFPSGVCGLTTLRELSIVGLDLETLTESIGNLVQLRFLEISYCIKLKALPKSIKNLTELSAIRLSKSRQVKVRCWEPDGEDWPLIQHIPHKSFIGRIPYKNIY